MSRLGVTFVASIVVAALAASGAGAHGVETAPDHSSEDAVTHTAAQERALDAHTRAVTAFAAAAAAAATAAAPQDVGEWGPVVDWPVVGVHVALLPDGKVLAYDSIGDNATETYPVHDHTRATVWDPATGIQTPVNVDTGFNVFCSGLAHLLDGRVFLAGGNKDAQLNGIVQTHIFDPAGYTWSLGPNMAAGRWYPTVTPLHNGEMLITSGRVNTPEVRTLAGGLRALSTASLSLPLYPWMDVAPDGRAFYSGPDQTLRALDTSGTGAWQSLGQRDTINRDYGGHALFDVGKMLVAGGGPSSKDARVVDVNGASPQVSATAPMAFGRRQHNLTVLADGSVLATGGNSSGAGLVDLNAGVYPAELWNPATGQWRTLAAMQITRQYHSTALLLADGRVLSSGGGICGTCDQVGYLGKNAEVFSPPYLFEADGTLAPRPAIDAAPASAGYGAPIEIATGNPAAIAKVGPRPARRRDALGQHGAALHPAVLHQRARRASPPPRRPMPTSRRRGRTCSSSSTPTACLRSPAWSASRRWLAADRHAHAAGERRDLHGAGHGESRGDGVRRRRHGDESRVLQRRGEARRGHDRALQLHLGRRGGRDLHAHRARHRQPRHEHDERTVHDHRQRRKHGADREHHLTRRRRDLPLEADDHDHGDGERSRRQRDEGRVPRRHDSARPGHERALLLHLEERPAREPHPDCARDRQRGRDHDQQSGRHHRAAEALSRAPDAPPASAG